MDRGRVAEVANCHCEQGRPDPKQRVLIARDVLLALEPDRDGDGNRGDDEDDEVDQRTNQKARPGEFDCEFAGVAVGRDVDVFDDAQAPPKSMNGNSP